ncbi:helix-turn-helix domain-containing protein [Pelovirga terrestris]|uniref:Winged helix-turn-helix domain-containing protein n=1 Tax=Pelovirga terrestris TaxID=2771352 RepID=A0A8J6UIL6_9BACT|nr:helix-turn-helix domain-containing protein [Pelovirga terrestris]MBD1401205.1 winged helix-turn-helix domain-containing protein [Pelovirga terrestris]
MPSVGLQHAGKIVLRPIGLTAQALGMARETLSRSLQRLVWMDGISYQRGQVHITDPGWLEQLKQDPEKKEYNNENRHFLW